MLVGQRFRKAGWGGPDVFDGWGLSVSMERKVCFARPVESQQSVGWGDGRQGPGRPQGQALGGVERGDERPWDQLESSSGTTNQ